MNEKNIRFPETFWDDLPFNLDVVRDIERVGALDGHFYHFLRARAESENTRYRADMYEKREKSIVGYRSSTRHGASMPLLFRSFLRVAMPSA